jgi:cyclic-di-GMP-binding protein
MADSSFDVVSKIDRQEVDNALNQAAKELATRFDFRGTDTKIAWKGEEAIELTSSTEERVKAAVDVFKEKLIRRDISLKAFDAGDPQASGKTYKVTGALKQGISSENAKARRPAGRHSDAQEGRPRRRAAVRQLPVARAIRAILRDA